MKKTCSKEKLAEYLRDESRQTGTCDELFFPETEEEIIEILKTYPHVPVTVQGARTGVTAGCVPSEGITVNLERMNRILKLTCHTGGGTVVLQPGVLLQTLREYIQPYALFFPPDPTETTASLGGMVSCNSSGARSFRYESIRSYVLGLDVILPKGRKLHLMRGNTHACGYRFQLTSCEGTVIRGKLPDLQMPLAKKHTAGYFIQPDMDLLDLFIGAEGTLGIVTAIHLKLLPQKKHTWGGVIFLSDEASALDLVQILRGEKGSGPCLFPEALEFFGCDALALLRQAQLSKTLLTEMELIRADACCAVYVEYASDDRSLMEQVFEETCTIIESIGADPFRTWAAINRHHMEKLRLFRHAAPECINMKIAQRKKRYPAITKLGTDMSVPDSCLKQVFSLYRSGLQAERLDSAIFGHIGNNHLHVNVIPKNMEEFYRTKALFAKWAEDIAAMGGSVCAEHGVGKLKTELLKKLYTEAQIDSMRDLKKCFDPDQMLNRGNIFTYRP